MQINSTQYKNPITDNCRSLNDIELELIKWRVKRNKYTSIEIGIFFIGCFVTVFTLMLVTWADGEILIGMVFFFFSLMLAFVSLAIWCNYKDYRLISLENLFVKRGSGILSAEMEGVSKSKSLVYRIDGNKVSFILPLKKFRLPSVGESKCINYESVRLFDETPMLGSDHLITDVSHVG
ncbi:hypothetical protein K5X82_11155 [Halosquirtibacter xylanolyticus]|uniref:hypothetical protein n=1 Tax=Halosquirtibacter xylanolyticus TaxID=3374599 RepID=UPI003748CD62|nr:hypothetical protein K5X82_11155 [Prolixibacteraceae bacterium]